ncbi:MAG: DUF4143 domain-containing protein [Deltaproteobacteria bacterium]|nr:DUF4143 domain-containing protein [Deltaproteobacteria bacterium]
MESGHEQPRNFFKIIKRNHTVKEREIGAVSPFPFMFRGFMPPLMHLTDDKDVLLWWEGYIKTYIERDLREMSQIDSLIGFRRVMAALALRSGNLVNQTEISRDTGVSQPTVHRYLKLLEVSNIVRKVPPYHTNRTKRIMKSPKIFFIDPGLSAYLSGYHHREDLKNARESGAFFENMVFLHLTILSELMIPKAKIFYWRTTTGREADFVVEHGKTLVAFEAKLTNKPSFEDIKNLLAFIEEYPETTRGVLLHAGSSIKWLHSRVVAVPWWWIGE